MTMSELAMEAIDYLAKPYARRLTPDEDGVYVATIQEFPGCIAQGDTAEEAMANLEAAAESWIEAQLALGQPIPEPIELHGYSGKIALRIPRGLHKQAVELAASEGTSLNQLLVSAISSYVGGKNAFAEMAKQLSAPKIVAFAFPSAAQQPGETFRTIDDAVTTYASTTAEVLPLSHFRESDISSRAKPSGRARIRNMPKEH